MKRGTAGRAARHRERGPRREPCLTPDASGEKAMDCVADLWVLL